MTSRRITLASFLTLGLLAVVGAFLILWATPEGLGLSDDSIAYIAGARSLVTGQGYRAAWLASNGPVTHFPPGFSAALAFISLTGISAIRAARFLNALLFGLNAALLGWLGWRMTKSSAAGIVLAALFVANDSLLRVHAVAMSEPLFLFFSLLAFLFFDISLSPRERGRGEGWLILTGLVTSLAYLTRYSGLALVATFVAALVLLQDTWRKRLVSAGIFLAGFLPLTLAWSIRNRLVAGNTTNRTLIWHPVRPDTLEQGLRTFSEFLVPVEEWRQALFKLQGLFIAALALVLLAILAWILINGLRRFFKPSTPMPEVIGFTNGLYVFGYIGAVLFSISFFDASTPLKVRILAPVYLPLLLLLVGAGVWVWKRTGAWTAKPPDFVRSRETSDSAGTAAWRVMVGAAALLVFSVSAVGQARTVADLSRGGQGFASFKWYDSKVMAYLRTLPADATFYTNQPGAVYLYTNHPSRVLPSHMDPVTDLPEPGFEQGVAAIQQDVQSGHAYLVLFDVGSENKNDLALLTQGLYPILRSGGDVIYYAPPPTP